jgi:hypothetical protein
MAGSYSFDSLLNKCHNRWVSTSGAHIDVNITLVILSESVKGFTFNPNKTPTNSTYFGYGRLSYEVLTGRNPGRDDYLTTKPDLDELKVLDNMAYSIDPNLRGNWSDFQSFLVKEPASYYWDLSISPGVHSISPHPQIAIPIKAVFRKRSGAGLSSWEVPLVDEDDYLLHGTGPDPVSQNITAFYCIRLRP